MLRFKNVHFLENVRVFKRTRKLKTHKKNNRKKERKNKGNEGTRPAQHIRLGCVTEKKEKTK
jgi:hypothetical protein